MPECSIFVVDDLSTGRIEAIQDLSIDYATFSILDRDALFNLTDEWDAIVHLAARPSVPRSLSNPMATHEVNATGTLNVLELARRSNAHVIVASSSSVYGANSIIPKSENLLPMPMSPYAVSKLAAERYSLAWQHSFGLPTLALRFFNVYGPGQSSNHAYAAVIPAFLQAVIDNRPVTIFGDGNQTRDFTYVETVCAVIRDALDRRVTEPEPVNLALGTRHSLNQLLETIQETLTLADLPVVFRDARPSDVRHSSADPNQLQRIFPDVPAKSLAEGIKETFKWLSSR